MARAQGPGPAALTGSASTLCRRPGPPATHPSGPGAPCARSHTMPSRLGGEVAPRGFPDTQD